MAITTEESRTRLNTSQENLKKTTDLSTWAPAKASVGFEGDITVSTPNIDATTAFGKEVASTTYNVSANVMAGAGAVWGSMQSLTDGDDWETLSALGMNAEAVLTDYINNKISDLKKRWTTTSEITLMAIMKESAPYVTDWSSAIKFLGDRISDILEKVTGLRFDNSLSDNFKGMGDKGLEVMDDMMGSLMTDPSILQTFSQLSFVKIYAQTASTVDQVATTVENLMTKVEGLTPLLKATYLSALSFVSGGTTWAAFTNDLLTLAQAMAQVVLKESYRVFKEMLFGVKLQLPSIVVDLINDLSVTDDIDPLGDLDTRVNKYFESKDDFLFNGYTDEKGVRHKSQIDELIDARQKSTFGEKSNSVFNSGFYKKSSKIASDISNFDKKLSSGDWDGDDKADNKYIAYLANVVNTAQASTYTIPYDPSSYKRFSSYGSDMKEYFNTGVEVNYVKPNYPEPDFRYDESASSNVSSSSDNSVLDNLIDEDFYLLTSPEEIIKASKELYDILVSF